ncbi:hypothetical protein QAD02_016986 [Eretmocerus hayati]|uniref:Uncharacterized protein n=1 Tax=Eretmocerus hayati TaxID=131215 RepID=A0ACC2PF55_9HYME|nr:hypothetical protein QAD02_016986 [Eretmocerus hayati]
MRSDSWIAGYNGVRDIFQSLEGADAASLACQAHFVVIREPGNKVMAASPSIMNSSSPRPLFFLLVSLFIINNVEKSKGFFFCDEELQYQQETMEAIIQRMRLKQGGAQFLRDYNAYEKRELPDFTPFHRQHFDFVVVGAGSAGSTIASRLTELPNIKVLLIEAGGHENLLMDVPLLALYLQLNKDTNWDYLSEPSDDYCRGVNNLQCKIARGKVMGGSSSINFMIATRGNKNDYDEWARLTGDPAWSYEEMLKYFKKLETHDFKLGEVDPEYHNFDGPTRIANAPYQTPLARAFVEAGKELGFPEVEYNGAQQTGFAYMQTNQINGERMSANRAYLHPARNRSNLFVTMHSHVTRLLIEPKTKTTWGVEFIKDGIRHQVVAKKEVILSAGGISSPQILMLSGIGPAKHLRSLNIRVLQDLPVGENMKDHIAYGGLFFGVNDTSSIVVRDFLDAEDPTIGDYLNNRTGRLATAGGCEGLGYVNVDDPMNFNNDRPNIELLFGSVSLTSSYFIRYPFGLIDEQYQKYFADRLYQHAWTILPLLMKPKSTGKILLRSKDPFAKPRIYSNYLSDPEDVRVSIQGIRWAIKVAKTQAMQKFGSRLPDRKIPGCEEHPDDSDEYWECALRTLTITLWHNSGTCRMGSQDDPNSVVNTKLQVKGMKRLRVVDTSIMPEIVTAHTHIPTIAIAEKFSDIIKKDWRLM